MLELLAIYVEQGFVGCLGIKGIPRLSVFKRLLNVYQTDKFQFRFKFVLGVGGCPPRELWQ